MPFVKLYFEKEAYVPKSALLAAHAALVEAFKIPENDRRGVALPLEESDLLRPEGASGHAVVIEISAFPGRSLEAKRALYQALVRNFQGLGAKPEDLFIILSESPKENWGIRGGQAACDVDLGFKVEV